MGVDISRFKVIHSNKVLNAIALMGIYMPKDIDVNNKETVVKPKFIEVLAINEDGNIVSIHDEAWTFQFIPIIGEGRKDNE